MVYKCQMEEFQRDLEAEQKDHERTKANYQSLNQQWKNMHQELMAKTKEVWKTSGQAQLAIADHFKPSLSIGSKITRGVP